jgi:capsular exopolysaccharide synthesis family protein
VTEKIFTVPPSPSGNGSDANYRLTVMASKRRYLTYLRERWWVVMNCLVLTIGGLLVYETLRPDSYTSYAQLYLTGNVQAAIPTLFSEESQNYFGTQIELLKSARLQGAAYQRINFQPKGDGKRGVDVEVVQPMNTSILNLRATGDDPQLTQRYLQALLDEYLNYKKETRISTSEDMVLSLAEELNNKEKELHAEQDKWAEFQKTNNVAVLEEEGKSAGLYLNDLNLQLSRLRLETDLLQKGISPAGDSTDSTATNPSTSNSNDDLAGDDASLKNVRAQLAIKRAEREKSELPPAHPAMRALSDEISQLERTVAVLEQQNREQRDLERKNIEMRIAAIESTIPGLEAKILDINARLSESQRLKNNIQRQQGYYDHLLASLQTADLSKKVQQERLSVLQPATAARIADRFLPMRIGVAAVGGLFLSLGIVFVWYLFDDRFLSLHDLKDQFGESVLGLIPQIRVSRANPDAALIQSNDSRAPYVESYRHLRSAILLCDSGEKRPQTLLLTSAVGREGKTTVAANLARVLCLSGFRVALVDTDPHDDLGSLFGVTEGAGLSDFLRGDVNAAAIVRSTNVPGLNLIVAGKHAQHAEGLFLRPQLGELLNGLKMSHEFVILDGPPLLSADDAALLVPHADAVILVARPFHTKSALMRRTLDMLYQRQAKQVDIILNGARSDDWAAYSATNGAANRNGRNGSARPAGPGASS